MIQQTLYREVHDLLHVSRARRASVFIAAQRSTTNEPATTPRLAVGDDVYYQLPAVTLHAGTRSLG